MLDDISPAGAYLCNVTFVLMCGSCLLSSAMVMYLTLVIDSDRCMRTLLDQLYYVVGGVSHVVMVDL